MRTSGMQLMILVGVGHGGCPSPDPRLEACWAPETDLLELVRHKEAKRIAEGQTGADPSHRGRIKVRTSPQTGIVLPGRGQFGCELVS
jgi:hypothetical protein